MSADAQPVGAEGDGGVELATARAAGVVTLTRAENTSALSARVRAAMGEALRRWARDPDIYGAVLRSATAAAFAGGGGERQLAAWAQSDIDRARAALADSYGLLWRMDCFSKPTIALIDGKATGLLAALSLYGTHRAAGERYRFAVPEVGFGSFPGHGLTRTLARMPAGIGVYLALTGRSIGRADAYRLGLVTHCVTAQSFEAICRAMADAEPVDILLDGWHQDPDGGELAALAAAIARCFLADTPEEIIARLRAEARHGPWAEAVIADLTRASPTSLAIAHRQLREAQAWDLQTTLRRDYRIACRLLEGADFFEGVNARLTGRGQPHWRPERLADVRLEDVAAYFAERSGEELQLASRAEMQAFKG